MGDGIDEDKASGETVRVVRVEKQRPGGFQFHHADVVEIERGGRLGIEGLHVYPMLDGFDPGLDCLRGVLQQIGFGRIERLTIHPNQGGGKVRGDQRRLVRGCEHLAPADIQLIFQGERDRHGRHGPGQIPVKGGDAFYPAGSSGGKSDDAIPRPHRTGSNLSGKAAVVKLRASFHANHALDRKTEGSTRDIMFERHGLQIFKQRGAFIPRHVQAAVDHVVSQQRADRDDVEIGNVELLCQLLKVALHRGKDLVRIIHQVHLVDGCDHMTGA